MSKHVLLPALVATLALAGCTANMNASVTPTTPGGSTAPSAAPGAGASTTPAVSASAGVSVGASTAPVAGNVDATLAAIYKVGRKWDYEVKAVAAGITTTTSFTREVLKVDGAKATVKTTTTAMGKTTESTAEVDLTQSDMMAVISKSEGGTTSTWTQSAVGDESLTVRAGTFACKKYTGKFTASSSAGGASATNAQDATFWVSTEVGLVKSVTTGSQTMSAGYEVQQLPGGFTMPGGGALPTNIPTSGTITIESTTELVSVTK